MKSSSGAESELGASNHRQQVLASLGNEALDGTDLDRLFDHATEALSTTLDADLCTIFELTPGGDGLVLREGVGWDDDLVGATTIPTETHSLAEWTLRSDDPISVDGYRTDDRFSLSDLHKDHDVEGGVCVTIGTAADPWGILEVHVTTDQDRTDGETTVTDGEATVADTGATMDDGTAKIADKETTFENEATVFTDEDHHFVQNVANVLASAIETRQANRRIEEESTLKDKIVDTSPIGITIVDTDGNIQFANDRAEEIFGRNKERINDLTFDDPEWDKIDANGEPITSERLPFFRILETGEPLFDQVSGVLRPNGERIWNSVNGAPLRDETGAVEGVVFAIDEITDQFHRERTLEQYETIVETIPDGAYVLDENQRYEFVNDGLAELTGYSREELVGSHVSKIDTDETVELSKTLRQELLTDEREVGTIEDEILTADGERVPVETRFSLLPFDDEFRGTAGITRDITERRSYQRQLEASNERLEQFAYAASHDLQEPLRMVTSYLTLIDDRYGEELDEDGREFIDFAVDGADRMREMIEGLLEYSRVETQGNPFDTVDLDDVLEDARTDLQVRIDDTDAEITADSLPCVDADGNQLRQVFQNLLDNAITYSGDQQPRVDISAHRNDDEWIISVTDDGIGIDPDDADRIFRVFERLHAVDDRSGSGIGLALCQRIVERHDGAIWVDSEPPNGSTFSFTLPVRDDHADE